MEIYVKLPLYISTTAAKGGHSGLRLFARLLASLEKEVPGTVTQTSMPHLHIGDPKVHFRAHLSFSNNNVRQHPAKGFAKAGQAPASSLLLHDFLPRFQTNKDLH